MNKSWSTEKEFTGYDIIIHTNYIEWNRYEIPSTNYSSGESIHYLFSEYEIGSDLFILVTDVFGSKIATEIYDTIKFRIQNQIYQ